MATAMATDMATDMAMEIKRVNVRKKQCHG